MKKQYFSLLVLSTSLLLGGCATDKTSSTTSTNNNSNVSLSSESSLSYSSSKNDSSSSSSSSVKLEEYNVTWIVDGQTSVEVYLEGEIPIYKYSTEKEADETYVYTFSGWDKELVPVTEDTTYTAQYSKEYVEYVYTWIVDGNITTENYHYGDTPSFKGDTSKEGDAQYSYKFIGWDKELTPVDGDETLTAQYDKIINKYEVTWNVDGNETKETYEYGEMPIYEGTPTKESDAQYSYSFIGWDKEIVVVTENTTYTAQFSNDLNEYEITWVVGNDETKETYKYGETPTFKGNTDRESAKYTYTFIGWDKEIVPVNSDATYVAQYTQVINTFKVTFYSEDGELLESIDAEYDSIPSYSKELPKKESTFEYTYSFAGWENRETGLVYAGELPLVIGNVDYYASFTSVPRLYDLKVKALNLDGTSISEETKQFGYNTVYNADAPTVEGKVANKDYVKGLMNEEHSIEIYYSELDIYDGTSISSSLEGEGTEANPYLITSGADLAYFRNEVNVNANSFEGKHLKLTKSIDISSIENFVIGNSTTRFAGHLDGNNCSIRGIKITQAVTRMALFYELLATGIVENVSTYGSVAGAQYAASLVGRNFGTVRNCTNYADVSHSGGNSAGGVVGGGDAKTSVIENCVNYGNVSTLSSSNNKPGGVTGLSQGIVQNCINFGAISGYKLVGGVVAEGASGLVIENCVNFGSVKFSFTGGGITSTFNGTSITNSTNYGEIELTERTASTASYYVGGISGKLTGGTITKSTNNGHVIGGSRIGGIAGQVESSISDCVNNGKVESNSTKESYVGGVCGVTAKTISVTGCLNNGLVTSTGLYSGGIVGCVATGAITTITKCINNGDIKSETNGVGGIIGGGIAATSSFTINECTNNGLVSGANKVGGIAGLIKLGEIKENCINNGQVVAEGSLSGSILGSDERVA